MCNQTPSVRGFRNIVAQKPDCRENQSRSQIPDNRSPPPQAGLGNFTSATAHASLLLLSILIVVIAATTMVIVAIVVVVVMAIVVFVLLLLSLPPPFFSHRAATAFSVEFALTVGN